MNNTAVIFIHGFTGGDATWVNEKGVSFPQLLETFPELSELDFHEFVYHTQILNIKNNPASKVVAGILNKVLPSKFKIKTPVIKKNTPIAEIAQELLTFVKYELSDYSNIIFISHSMGGLISKNLIVDVIENEVALEHDIIGYCSLATPHKGSIPSILMAPFNINAKEMKPLDRDNNALNDKWIEHGVKLDKTLYVRAKSDEVVDVPSSIPFNDNKKFPFDVVEADHTSICKPSDASDRVCKVVRKFLLDCISKAKLKNTSMENFAEESSSYDKEVFVIKLMLAKVDSLLIADAKESFFLAEIIEKQASKSDRKIIEDLTLRVLSVYKNIAGAGSTLTSSELVSKIHERIMTNDKHALDCAIKYVSFMHKKGFLHQKANQENLTVNWSKDVSLADIESYRDLVND
ncbi:hypothetical protein J1N51_04635 [Psychrosphaera ytuae]|uniref:DUF676 domain-containing protein n=1 Tax=Psychrosphaera ytuae TaxID=2820710 RepID=A0A975HKX3_9GAMM|nr:ABC-three component system protein [Psychrosphaera ytuae]QTH64754.1 hypothetical protein J1N51_04635 [Psychrosphaera ytuae]